MTTNTVGSSDVDIARVLSRRLSGLDTGSGLSDPGASPYLRFAPAAPDALPSGTAGEAPADEALNDFTRWDEFLAWSLNKVRSSAAFAGRSSRLLSSARAATFPEDGFEGTGAELSYVMSQADVLKPEMGELRSVELEYADRRVAGFRVESADAKGFLIAFIDAEGFTDTTRNQIARQLDHSFSVLL